MAKNSSGQAVVEGIGKGLCSAQKSLLEKHDKEQLRIGSYGKNWERHMFSSGLTRADDDDEDEDYPIFLIMVNTVVIPFTLPYNNILIFTNSKFK